MLPVRRPGTSRAWWVGVGLLVALTGGLRTAGAGVLDVHGYGARGSAMGGALTAAAGDFSAVYYNPAAMVLQPDSQIVAGLLVSHNGAHVRLAPRPAGYDPPDLGANSPSVPYAYRLRPRQDTNEVPGVSGLYVGAVTNLGLRKLRFGMAAHLPLAGLGDQRTHFPDEREQFFSNQLRFERLGERLRSQVVLVGLAYSVADWLAFGVGLSWQPETTTDTYSYLHNPADQSKIDLNLDVSTGSRYGLRGGMLISPTDWLRFGAGYRDESFLAVKGLTEVQVRGFHGGEGYPLYQEIHQVLHFTPRRLNVGFAVGLQSWTLSVDLHRLFWSRYLGEHAELAGFNDTWAPRAGVEWLPGLDLRLWGGVAWDPSPVPDQVGRTNYVDNDRVSFSAGLGRPFRFYGRQLDINAFAQIYVMPWRETRKRALARHPTCGSVTWAVCDEVPVDTADARTGERLPEAAGLQTGNPGFPGFVSGGWGVAAGAEAQWKF